LSIRNYDVVKYVQQGSISDDNITKQICTFTLDTGNGEFSPGITLYCLKLK